MAYFSGIEWVSGGHIPRCTAWVDKAFADYFCINYAHSGRVKFRFDRHRFVTLEAPVAWWSYPGPWFQYGSDDGTPWDHYYLCFRGPRWATYAEQGLVTMTSPRPWIRIADPVQFCREFEALIAPDAGLTHTPQRRIHQLESLLLHLAEPPRAPAANRRDERLRALIDRIRQAPAAAWDFSAEARRLRLSAPHFHRLFRQLTRQPPRRFVIRARLEWAAQLLHAGDQPLKDIAATVGCPDIYYFSRLFRRHFGVPPGKYRRETGIR